MVADASAPTTEQMEVLGPYLGQFLWSGFRRIRHVRLGRMNADETASDDGPNPLGESRQ